jgi:biotin synthase
MKDLKPIIEKMDFSVHEIVELLDSSEKEDLNMLMEKAYSVKKRFLGENIYLRGLIELSNYCNCNCLYCGIRKDNRKIERYTIEDEEVIKIVRFAIRKRLNGIVIQAGETRTKEFTGRITSLIKRIKIVAGEQFRITLSLGEQSSKVYKEWFEAGASRYLLRIETTNESLFRKIHPAGGKNTFNSRLKCLDEIKKTGYQTGTGVMIGLPFQTNHDLANDVIFMKYNEFDMIGMGPYIYHPDTPLYKFKNLVFPSEKRFELSLKMIAVSRIMMPYVNIASATALQSLDLYGREKALKAGANVLMPNITPAHFKQKYILYHNKPFKDETPEDSIKTMENKAALFGEKFIYDDYGDSLQYNLRTHK